MRFRGYAHVSLCFLALATLVCPPVSADDCSPYVNRMTFNEVYEQGNDAWVEIRLIDESVSKTVYITWSIRLCADKKGCFSYSLADAVILYPDDFPNYLVLEVDKNYIDLKKNGGMDAVLQDSAGDCIDYLSVNNINSQAPSCGGLLYPTATGALDGNRRGIYRDVDGTGPWHELGADPEVSEPTKGKPNKDLTVAIDHFEIVHDSMALTCVSETVTVRACVDADCTELYADDITIDLLPAGWIGGDSQTLSGGSGLFRLSHSVPETVTLTVSSQDMAAENVTRCVDGSAGSSCDLTFFEAGFAFDLPDMRSCGPAENIRIAAVRADATGERCIGDDSFADTTRIVNFWSSYQEPATGTRPVTINGSAVAGASPGTAVQLVFDAQAESLLAVRYDDAGRVALSARFDGTGDEAGLLMTGSDSFVAAPDHLVVSATKDGTTPLDNTTTNGDPHWPAGENFVVAVSGVCADGSVTPNFAAMTNFAVAAADPAPGMYSGPPLEASDYGGGTASGTAAYNEVGNVTLQAEVSDYLGSGIDISGTAVVGRFTPHSFAASLNSPEFAPACTAEGFTYIGQPFVYSVAPVITVTARNKNGDTTENYTGDWWKITSVSLTGKSYATETGILDLTSLSAGDPVISDLGGGIGLLTFGDGGGISFVRDGTPQAPFDAEISLSINILDADSIAASTNPVTFGVASAGNGIAFSGDGKQMFWGRLTLQNAYGSERVPLAMPFRAENYDGTTFVNNTLDDCTGVALDRLSLSNGSITVTADNPIPVGSGSSSASLSAPFTDGAAGLVFSAPGSEGTIQVEVDLSSLPWLSYDWNGDSIQEGPSALATFGIYKGRPRLIYFQEAYR